MMNTTIKYTIEILSNAEPGTGLGGELINQRIPRDETGKPVIPANHIKGLLREELMKLEFYSNLSGITARCLGRPDDKDTTINDLNEAICRFTDARLSAEASLSWSSITDSITRTAIDKERGSAKAGSLRTNERIVSGTKFCGHIYISALPDSQEALALRCGLLAIAAIGGNRNRGAGKVLISIEGEKKLPGELLKELHHANPQTRGGSSNTSVPEPGTKLKTLRLLFTAQEPVCLPERPVGTGPIESGFAISSSAVRGWIISRLAQERGDAFAAALYKSKSFRAWPLLPCGYPCTDELTGSNQNESSCPVPMRVSLTHKIAKLITDGDLNANDVEDKPIYEVDWEKIPNNNPLKASDGVLLVSASSSISASSSKEVSRTVELWKAKSMPKIMTAHGVHNDPQTKDGRNLYQIESIAPLVWSGFVVLPENWAEELIKSVKNDATAAFGRFRSTHGFGTVKIEECQETAVCLPWSTTEYDNILVLQSPILLQDHPADSKKTANQEFEDLIRSSWHELFERLGDSWCVHAISTNIGIRFGWNRSEQQKGTGKGQRQSAKRVVLPGSIFEICPTAKYEQEKKNKIKLDRKERQLLRQAGLTDMIQRGLGDGIERGFGAVCVHPGIATKVYSNEGIRSPKRGSKEAEMTQEVLLLWEQNQKNLPSVSQISALAGIASKDRKAACDYLENQTMRLVKIWDTWKPIIKTVTGWLEKENEYSDEILQFGLKLLADLKKYQDQQTNKNTRKQTRE